MSLFTGSMLGLVISNNLVQTYIFWELVGLCSYLLIGFWYRRPAAAAAAKKAFVVTRFGDLGFLDRRSWCCPPCPSRQLRLRASSRTRCRQCHGRSPWAR